MGQRVLITGGAGFIGTNLARKLLLNGDEITILDNFNPQIHGGNKKLPLDLEGRVKLIVGDVTDEAVFDKALSGQDVVVHLAAETGTGQSMYQIKHYSHVNAEGTAILCDYLVNQKHSVKKVVVASSRAIYGEGKYECGSCGVVYPEPRTAALMKEGIYEPVCPVCGKHTSMKMLQTDEDSKIHPTSIYGITKQVQEEMVLVTCRSIGIDAFALRYQNVYGPGQSLKNPYTGILSIFSRLAFNHEAINIFEDGLESRDFVYIEDIALATMACINSKLKGQHVFNVGSADTVSVISVAETIVKTLNSKSKIAITGAFREGDIRHNSADLSRLKNILGFEPKWKFKEGLKKFLEWVLTQEDMKGDTGYQNSLSEMQKKGLFYQK